MGRFWRRAQKGRDGDSEDTPRAAKQWPQVWCPTCPPHGRWVKAYKPDGPPIKHKPCMDDDDTVITRQLPVIPRENKQE